MTNAQRVLNRMRTARRPTLYWSRKGEIACLTHAPWIGSDTWVDEDWERMQNDEQLAHEMETGAPPECEGCRARRERGIAREVVSCPA